MALVDFTTLKTLRAMNGMPSALLAGGGAAMTHDEANIICADADLYGEERQVEEATEQFVSFRVGDEWYAVTIVSVREVVRASQIAFLPSAPAHIVGVINLRGNIISVTDPKCLFGLATAPPSQQQRIVIVESVTADTGLLVDEVGEVVTVPISQLEPPLATFDTTEAGFIQCTCRWGERLLAILKTEKLLTVTQHEVFHEQTLE